MRLAAFFIVATCTLAGPALAQTQVASPSFEDVLAAPDDRALNVAYAQQQIAGGHMLYAAAAYERLLLERPDDDPLRLDYVDVLMNLDDSAAARREIGKLDLLSLSADQQTRLAAQKVRLAKLTPDTVQ